MMMLNESTGNFSAPRNVYDWYQTNTHIILNIMIKNLTESDVKVRLIDDVLDVTCSLADGNQFKLHFNLFKPIYVQESNWSVTPSKLEIKLKKTDRKRWQSLEQIPEKANKRLVTHSYTMNLAHLGIHSGISNALVTKKAPESKPPSTVVCSSPKRPKHDWYQGDTHVTVVVHIRNLTKEDVKVQFNENHLFVECKCEDGTIYKLDVDLFKSISPNECTHSLTPSKLEIRMKKAFKGRWSNLEAIPVVLKNVPEAPVLIVTQMPTPTVEMVDDCTLPLAIPDGTAFETVECPNLEANTNFVDGVRMCKEDK